LKFTQKKIKAHLKSYTSRGNLKQNKMKKQLLFSVAILAATLSNPLMAQHNHEKCATMTNQNARIANDPSLLLKMQEGEKITQQWLASNAGRATNAVITIPVVFHIVHNGEALGTGNNVSDSIVMYQLKRINEDYRKRNADTLMPSNAFYPDQADVEVEFCLAKRTPAGVATSGIVRHNIAGASWSISEVDSLIKPSTIWDRNKYINVWCVNLVDPASPGVDGYATFPTATTDSTDGVVVASFAFGYNTGGAKSIVATHELGHYFNLLHIWGDGTCASDSVADTPPAEMANSGCPTQPYNVAGPCNPGANGEMFMNYMDYSDAACVVMFSNGQKARMLAAINTFRSSLTTSNGCEATNVGINETANSQGVSIYPNPTFGNFSIAFETAPKEAVSIVLHNQLGAVVKEFNAVNSFSIYGQYSGLVFRVFIS
jgi:hypothetical protein